MIWLTPDEPAFTVAGQRRDLTELPPQGSGGTLSVRPKTRPLGSTAVKRFVKNGLAVALVGAVAFLGACSSHPYTSERAVRDLEEQSGLTRTQAECVVKAIRLHFKTLIAARQKALGGSALPSDRLRLEVDNALGSIKPPKLADELATRRGIAKCAPNALR